MTTRTPESTDDDSAAAPRPLPYLPDDVRILGGAEQRGDGLVHDVLLGLRQGRLREYAPAGVAERDNEGRLVPIAGHEAAWADGCARFLDQAQRLYAAAPAAAPRIWRVGDMASGVWTIAAPTPPPLSATLANGPALAPAEIIRLAHGLAEALAELHTVGVTHLDICPDTVVVAQGQVSLTDFAVDDRAFLALRGDTQDLVRPGYSPIEMYDGGQAEPLGPATDIYAAAAVILRLMTGRAPPTWQDRWHDSGPLPIAVSAVDYPPAFVAAIRHALAIEPGQRFADAWSWRQAMGDAAPVTVDPGPTATTYPEPSPQFEPWPTEIVAPAPAGNRGWILVAIVALLGLVALAAIYFALRQPGESAGEAAAQYVVTGPANVRSGPSPGDPVIARLAAGERVTGAMSTSAAGERWLRISEGTHAGHYIWAGNLTLAGAGAGATPAPPRAAEPPATNVVEAAAPAPVDSDGELSRWIVGGWASVSSGCETDGGDFLSADGRYGDYGREGRWRIENGNLVVTITHVADEYDDLGPMRRLDQPRTDATPITREGPDRMTRVVDGGPVRMMRCPSANFEFSS